jgi:hypothetical protein
VNLTQLEGWFWHGVRAPRPPADVARVVAGESGLAPVRRLGIYASAYWTRQIRVLSETFERTEQALGSARFVELARAYLETYPSSAPAVEWVGERFASYLAALPAESGVSGHVVDLARLEWARLEALLAPDAEGAVEPAVFGAPTVGRSIPRLAPSLRVVEVSAAAVELAGGGAQVGESGGRSSIAVWRRGFGVVECPVPAEEAAALARAAAGAAFERVCAEFSEPGGVTRAALAIARWAQRRWLVALTLTCLALVLSGCGGEEPSSEFGFAIGPEMQPGDDCLRCHSAGSEYPTAPHWTAAGTVFPAPDSSVDRGVSGVKVLLTSGEGTLLEELVTNSAGNFYTTAELPRGFRVALEHLGARVQMPCPPPAGNCGACHALPPIGGAPGRIFVPGGGMLSEPPPECGSEQAGP